MFRHSLAKFLCVNSIKPNSVLIKTKFMKKFTLLLVIAFIALQSMAQSTITFVVKNASALPIPGVDIFFNDLHKATDSLGVAIFLQVPNGNYAYVATRTDFNQAKDSVRVTGANQTISVKLNQVTSTNNLTFKLIDNNGKQVPSATVSIVDLVPPITQLTDSTGTTVFKNIPDGLHYYYIRKDGFSQSTSQFTSNANSTMFNVMLNKLLPNIVFVVKGNNGFPLRGVNISVTNLMNIMTDSTGTAILQQVPNGTYNYVANVMGYQQYNGIFTCNGANATVSIILNAVAANNLTFKVVDNNGAALAGVTIQINDYQMVSMTTDQTGTAVFQNVPDGNHNYTISKAGFATIMNPFVSGPSSKSFSIMLYPVVFYDVYFNVVDNNNVVVQGATIHFQDITIADQLTDASGNAKFPQVPSGQHNYTISKTGFNTRMNGFQLDNTTQTIYCAIMHTGNLTLTFIVKDNNGNPVPNVSVGIDNAEYNNTDNTGTAIFTMLPPGNHNWNLWCQGYNSTNGNIPLTGNTTFTTIMTKQDLSTKRVIFMVVDQNGKPLRGATVNCNGPSGTTDSTGQFIATGLPLGVQLYANVYKQGYTSFNIQITASNSQDQYIKAILQLASTKTITFHVFNEKGQPFPNAYVSINNMWGFQTDATGTVVATNLPFGMINYNVSAGNNNNYNNVQDSVLFGNTNLVININLQIVIRSKYFLNIYAIDPNNLPIPNPFIAMGKDTIRFDANGLFRQNNIQVGTYNLILSKAGYYDTPFSITIDTLSDKIYKIIMKPIPVTATKVTFTVIDQNGKPVPRAGILIDSRSAVPTDSTGTAIILGLPVGVHNYYVLKDGLAISNGTFTLGVTALTIAVKMSPATGTNYTLKVLVKNAQGNKIPGALVQFDATSFTTTNDTLKISNVMVGVHNMSVTSAGYSFYQSAVTVSSTSNKTITITLIKVFKVTFVIKDGSKVVPQALISLGDMSRMTDSTGTAVFVNVLAGNMNYSVLKPQYLPVKATINVTKDTVDNLNLSMIKFSVTFKVVNETGVAVAGANVNFNNQNLLTNADGVATFSNTVQGPGLMYDISKTGFNDSKGAIDVFENVIKPVTISSVGKAYNITIAVWDGAKPIPNATVVIDTTIRNTDGNGLAQFNNYAASVYTATISSQGFITTKVQIEVVNTNILRKFNLIPVTYSATITVVDTANIPIQNTAIKFGNFVQFTDENGMIEIDNLVNGKYVLGVGKPGYLSTSDSIIINGASVSKTVTLKPVATKYSVTFNVTDGTNKIAGALVSLYDINMTTDANGQAIFPSIAPGQMMYYVKANGYAPVYDGLQVSNANVVKNITLATIHAPTDFSIVLNNINENIPAHTKLTNFHAITNSPQNILKYWLTGFDNDSLQNDNKLFYIQDSSLYCQISFNYEIQKTYTIVVRALDIYNNTTDKSFTITVVNQNDPPVFTSQPIIFAKTGTLYSYDATVFDEDNNTLTITAPVLPSWLTLGTLANGKATLSGTPTAVGAYSVMLAVSDGIAISNQNFILVVLSNTVTKPPQGIVKTVSINENGLLTIPLPALDSIDPYQNLQFQLVQNPAHADNFMLARNMFIYQPVKYWFGMDSVSYKVRNSYGLWSTEVKLYINVIAVNNPPSASSGSFTFDNSGSTLINIAGLISDVETPIDSLKVNFILSYDAADGEGALGGKLSNVSGTFWQYSKMTNTNMVDYFYYYVTDAGGLNSEVRVIKIMLPSGKDGKGSSNILAQNVTYNNVVPGQPINISLVGIDLANFQPLNITPTNSDIKYGTVEWSTVTSESGLSVMNGTYTATTNSTVSENISFLVSNGTSAVTAFAVLNITPVKTAPVVGSINNISFNEGSNTTVPITYSDQTTVTWTATSYPVVPNMTFQFSGQTSTAVNLKITPPSTYVGNCVITVTATNSNGLTTSQDFVINVAAVKQPPVVAAISAVSSKENIATTITVNYNDPDSQPTFILWSATSDVNGFTFAFTNTTTTSVTLTITPPTGYIGNANITVKAMDETSLSSTQQFVITLSTPNAVSTINQQSISVYPNPANGRFQLTGITNASVSIYNIYGMLIATYKNVTGNNQFDISKYSNGSYIIKVNENNTQFISKIELIK